MATVTLSPGIQVVAFKLQEAMMQSDVRARLSDAINDAHRAAGQWGYYIDHTGDESGDVVYSCNGDVRMCSYEIAEVNGKSAVSLDMEDSRNVVPTTTYQEEADDDDHYAGMQEAFKASNIYTDLPIYERFISKGERDKADEGSFAGKGKSFPILKPSDVGAAVHAIGRAGSGNYGMAQLKANIVKIAKAKGWEKYLPKAWRGDSSTSTSEAGRKSSGTPGSGSTREAPGSSSRTAAQGGVSGSSNGARQASESDQRGQGASANSIQLTESAATLETIVLREAKADYEIKLIAPGKGSSAFYPAEVLKRDGPNVFKAGTHVYLNHPTAIEEAARPEGDVKNLAGVLSTTAVYHESHAKGPGLYARMKVFADHGQLVEEKAPHVGMSIRASGVAESNKKQDGLPILKELTSAESVDVVTRAGAGGMILTEAAKPNQQEGEMTLQEAQKLIDEGVSKATAPLLERALRGDAREEALNVLEGSRLPDATKRKIVESALRSLPLKDGVLDVDAFRKVVVAEAKAEAQYLAEVTGSGRVVGMGPSFGTTPEDPDKVAAREKAERKASKRLKESEQGVFGRLMGNTRAAELAASKGEAA